MKLELFQTQDGSYSLFNPAIHDTYHSRKGAVTESQYVFIQQGLVATVQKNSALPTLRLLEVGFGTGLNALLTAQYVQQHPAVNIFYEALETYPITWQMFQTWHAAQWFSEPETQQLFEQLHQAPWQQPIVLTSGFVLQKVPMALLDFQPTQPYHLVFYDAFAPNNQPEMWTETVFKHVYQLLHNQGVMVTYCAKGQVKRTLKTCGFVVETLPGPPGKREMIRAIKAT